MGVENAVYLISRCPPHKLLQYHQTPLDNTYDGIRSLNAEQADAEQVLKDNGCTGVSSRCI